MFYVISAKRRHVLLTCECKIDANNIVIFVFGHHTLGNRLEKYLNLRATISLECNLPSVSDIVAILHNVQDTNQILAPQNHTNRDDCEKDCECCEKSKMCKRRTYFQIMYIFMWKFKPF